MATYLELVTMLLKYTEKRPFNLCSVEQIEQAVRDINDARRLTWNHGDLSFKTVIARHFPYTVVTDPDAPGKGTPLPSDFLGFHKTGKVYIESNLGQGPLEYLSYQRIIDRTEGGQSTRTGTPSHYGVGGPSDPDPDNPANQRELLLWPTPNTSPIMLKLIYQLVGPPDVVYDSMNPNGLDIQVPRIPETWHIPVILGIARKLRKMDKGADDSAITAMAKECIAQMMVQEPHGRERAAHNPINRAWRRR